MVDAFVQGHANQHISDVLGASTSSSQGADGVEAEEPVWVALRHIPGDGGRAEEGPGSAQRQSQPCCSACQR